MHNNIMETGLRDRPPMLSTGRYTQWQSRFLRYIDTRPNGDALRKCILEGPYKLTTVTIPVVPAIDDTLAVLERTAVETLLTMSPENKALYESEKEAIHLLLTGIVDEIYLTVDACKIAHEMWIAIERLQQEWLRFVTIFKQQHDLDTVSYHKLFDVLKQYQKEVNEIRAERIAKNANPLALVAAAQPHIDPYYQAPKSHKPYAPTSKQSSSTRSNASTRFKGKEIAKPITPPYESVSEEESDPEQAHRDKDMQKNLALIAKYLKKIYKPTNNNLRTSSNSRNKNVDTFPRYRNDNQTGNFGNQRTVIVVEARETVGSHVVQQTGIQCFNCKEFDHFAKKCRKPKREVPTVDSGTDTEPLEHVDSNIIPDSPDMCDNDIHTDQNAIECDDERVVLANLILNLKLDVDENKKIQKQLKKANTSLAYEMKECKSILAETSRTLGESNSIWDSCLIALQNNQAELEKYKTLNDLVKEKHDDLVKQSLLTKSHYEGLVKEKTKIPYDQSDPANKLVPDREETQTLEKEIRSKLNKDLVRPYDYTKLNKLVDQAWEKHSHDHFRAPTAHGMEILIKTCLMPLAIKTQNDSFTFVHELKQEVLADLKYVESLEKEINELESDKAEFSNMYEILLQECESNDVMCSYLHSLSNLDAHTELQCLYLHKVKECECLAQKLSTQTKTVSKEVYTGVLRSFAKLEKHYISRKLALQQCQEQMKNDTVCKEKASNVFLKEREQYFEIQDLKAQLQDKNNSISELNKLIEKCKGKSVETKFGSRKIMIKRVYYLKGLNHNLFSVGQFYDADLEVAFQKSKCFIGDLQGNDLLTGTSSDNKSTSPIDNSKQQDTPPTTNIQSSTEPKTPTTNVNVEENSDNQAVNTQEELHQFDRLQVWELVDKPFSKTVIKLKWLWKNKKDEDQTVIRNKA
ncbi:retrovirus-related pol polyprotein from transposon TNT 1-94 [Tanacetum coccineum]